MISAVPRMVRTLCAVCSVLALGVVVPGRAGMLARPVVSPQQVDELFARWNRSDLPGCAVGLSVAGDLVLTRAYGMADLEHGIRNTADTIFEAGSVSKQFTAAAVLLLEQAGKLSLDDPAQKYLPELPDYGAPLTIRHMLTHTSGLRDWGVVAAVAGWPRGSRVHTHAHVLDIASRQRSLNFTPGAEYSYSNTGYNLAAMIVGRTSGVPFAEFTRRELFAPLGMTHTSWRDDFTRIVPGRALAYRVLGTGVRLEMPFENVHGNGGLLTTVRDLLAWNENFVAPKVGGRALVERQLTRGRLNDGRQIEYAAGLYVTSWRGIPEVSHGGATAGYRAFLARYPQQHLSVAVLCNADNANAPQLGRDVAALYLGDRARDTRQVRPASVPAETLEARAGLYRNTREYTAVRLVLQGGRLRLVTGEPLTPISSTAFLMGSGDARVEFDVDGSGQATSARMLGPDGDIVQFERVEEARLSPAALQEYVGTYASDEADTTMWIIVENGRLLLRRRPDTVVALEPEYADAFDSAAGHLRFLRDATGRITQLSVGLPRVRDLRFTRVPAEGE